jgi:hypothetical protein
MRICRMRSPGIECSEGSHSYGSAGAAQDSDLGFDGACQGADVDKNI